jgi:hypothetical protein
MKGLASQGSKYTDKQRRQAIGAFVILGNYQATANEVNIPYTTVFGWGQKEWWLNALEEVRREKADELDVQVSNSITKALKSVDERLEHGDAYVLKDGGTAYKPVSARDSATVFGIMYDKRALMRNMPTSITQSTDSAKLLKLQEKFEELASSKIKEVQGSVVVEG